MPPATELRNVVPDRAPQLIQQFEDELRRAGREGGRALFVVDADPAALEAYFDAIRERAGLISSGIRIAYLTPSDALATPGGLWPALANRLTMQRRVQRFLRKVLPEWLDVVPVVGKVLHAAVATYEAHAATKDDREGKRLRRLARGRADSAANGVRMLLDIAPRDPRLALVPRFEQATTEDLAGTAALLRVLPQLRLLVVCGCVAGPDGRLPADVASLVAEAERNRTAARVLLRARVRAARSERDQPAFADLDATSLDLLRLGAIQGTTFYSVVVSALAGLDELDAEDRFAALARRGVIEVVTDGNVDQAVTTVYRLPPGLIERLKVGAPDAGAAETIARRYDELRHVLGLPDPAGTRSPTG